MKRKHFSVEQIVAVLKQAELGMPVADILRQVGISQCKEDYNKPKFFA
jgi:putative transposase